MSRPVGLRGIDLPPNVPEDRVVDFDMYNPPNIENGLQEAWAALQTATPYDVIWTPRNEGHWIAVSAEVLKEVSADTKTFSNKINFLPKSAGSLGLLPTALDPPEHRPYRRVLNEVFGPPSIQPLEPSIRKFARALIEAVVPRGSCDFVKDYSSVLPIKVFMELLDLPLEDAGHLTHIADQMTRPDGSMTPEQTTKVYNDYLTPIIEARREHPGTDALTRVVNAEVGGKPMTLEECRKMVGLLLLAGLDTVVNLLAFIMQFLASNPATRRQIAQNADALPHAMEELLRRFGPVADARLVVKTKEIDGVTLLEGDMISRPTMLYGLDPAITPCPMDVDVTRESVSHFTFGHGIHSCPGTHLARLELKVTIEEWLRAVPEFEIVPGAKVQHHSGIVGAVESLPLQWPVPTSGL
jgi:cytochrome P450